MAKRGFRSRRLRVEGREKTCWSTDYYDARAKKAQQPTRDWAMAMVARESIVLPLPYRGSGKRLTHIRDARKSSTRPTTAHRKPILNALQTPRECHGCHRCHGCSGRRLPSEERWPMPAEAHSLAHPAYRAARAATLQAALV